MTGKPCFHCGLPVPENSQYQVKIQGQLRAMCCPGCQAVATAISEGGLEKFYQFRSENAVKPDVDRQALFAAYDLPEVSAGFITETSEGISQVCFIVGGITCAACSWLIEKYLKSLPFVTDVTVNVSAHRATVNWYLDRGKTQQGQDNTENGNAQSQTVQGKLSQILAAFAAIGYEAIPVGDERANRLRQKENRQALLRLGVAGLGMMQAGMLAIALYAGALQGMDTGMETFLRWVSLVFSTPVVFYSGRPFLRATLRCIKMTTLTMDVPVSIAILLAWGASLWATIWQTGDVYFDSVSMFVFFLLLGRYLEMRVRHRNELLGEGLSQWLPTVAMRITDSNTESVSVTQLTLGDLIKVSGGDIFPCDGEVVAGISEVNESLLTGEQRPVLKQPGSDICAGSVNGNTPLVIKVSATGQATRLSTIVNLVEQAQSEKPPQQMIADKFAGYFIAAVLGVAILVGVFWWINDAQRALWVVLSVLVVTCPCALSLATPAALAVASAELRRKGFLITHGHVLETLAKANRVIFDKTGTLTLGQMEVTGLLELGEMDKATILNVAAVLESGSRHPIAKAFNQLDETTGVFKTDAFKKEAFKTDAFKTGTFKTRTVKAENIEHHLGQAVTGTIDGVIYGLGKPEFICEKLQITMPDQPEVPGKTLLLFARLNPPMNEKPDGISDEVLKGVTGDGQALAWIILQDQLRSGVKPVLAQLKQQGLKVELLSGDRPSAVAAVANALQIDSYAGGKTPEDKLAHLQALQQAGNNVVMVGDGINDVPVLSGADVSIAMGDASDLTRIHADSILLSGDFASLEYAFVVARKTRKIIRQNIGWAVMYNLAALPLAVAGMIPPWAAAIGMSASSLLVVVNALRLRQSAKNEKLPEVLAVN